MARLFVLSLLLTLALASSASAATAPAERASAGWQNLFLRSMAQLTAWLPVPGLTPPKQGVLIVPNGLTGPPPAVDAAVHTGSGTTPPRQGVLIIPNGLQGSGGGPDRPDGMAPLMD